MKRVLNTLFLMTEGTYLARKNDTLLVRIEKETRLRVPIHTLDSVVCFGQVSCSPAAMGLCAEHNVLLSFLSMNGRFLARVHGPVSGNVLLRREQYRRADDEATTAAIARAVVTAKLANGRNVILRALRDRPDHAAKAEMEKAIAYMAHSVAVLEHTAAVDTIRGVEGEAARTYFEVFDHLITNQKQDFFFRGRSRRPPLDNTNALLSFVYTLLVHDVTSALEAVGLDPAVGFLHRDRPGRPSLALDLMEELRPYLADRLVLSLINRGQVNSRGFATTETGAVQMDDKTRKEVLVAWQKRKQEEITHPFIGEKIHVGMISYVQAMLLARCFRGELDGYPPFLWK